MSPEFWVGKCVTLNTIIGINHITLYPGQRAIITEISQHEGWMGVEVYFEVLCSGQHHGPFWSGYWELPSALELLAEAAE